MVLFCGGSFEGQSCLHKITGNYKIESYLYFPPKGRSYVGYKYTERLYV